MCSRLLCEVFTTLGFETVSSFFLTFIMPVSTGIDILGLNLASGEAHSYGKHAHWQLICYIRLLPLNDLHPSLVCDCLRKLVEVSYEGVDMVFAESKDWCCSNKICP